MNNQNSRTRRKMAAGFKGEGSHTDFNIGRTYGSLNDKAEWVKVCEKNYAVHDKGVQTVAKELGLYSGKHTGSKPTSRLPRAIARYHKQMESLKAKKLV